MVQTLWQALSGSVAGVLAIIVLAACSPVVDQRPQVPGPTITVTVPVDRPRPLDRIAVVDRVIDGDTIALAGGERVRLLTIDAPELNARTAADDAECGAMATRDALARLLPPATEIGLAGLPGVPAQDRFGRTLADVFVRASVPGVGPVNVSLRLVDQGWARTFHEYRTMQTDEAADLEKRARQARRGIWASCP